MRSELHIIPLFLNEMRCHLLHLRVQHHVFKLAKHVVKQIRYAKVLYCHFLINRHADV